MYHVWVIDGINEQNWSHHCIRINASILFKKTEKKFFRIGKCNILFTHRDLNYFFFNYGYLNVEERMGGENINTIRILSVKTGKIFMSTL